MEDSQLIQLGAAVAILWLVAQILRTVFRFIREDLRGDEPHGSGAPSSVITNDVSAPINLMAMDRDYIRDHLAETKRIAMEGKAQVEQLQRQVVDLRTMILRIEYILKPSKRYTTPGSGTPSSGR